jgi:hypothetical protein
MADTLIAQKRAEYIPLGLGSEEYCIGNRSELSHFEEEGAVIVPWNKAPNPTDFGKIKCLRLKPTESQIKRAEFPAFVRELTNLYFLEIPLPMALNLQQESIPKQIKTLMISNEKSHIEMLKSDRKELTWPDIVLPNIKALWLFNSSYSTQLNTLLNITTQNFPNLEYIECSLDKEGSILNVLTTFKSLLFAQIGNVYEFDNLCSLSDSLKFLAIIGSSKDFKMETIAKIRNLKSLLLNSIKSEVNCNVLTHLPILEEITVLNSKNIININDLLKCENLRNISFVNCNKPFKSVKNDFLPTNYNILDIKYS